MARNPVQFQKGISLNEFLSLYGTEQQCFDALYRWRWPNGFVCPNCGHDRGCQLTTHKLQQCYRCNRQTSITAGTIFEATKLPLTVWFQGIYLLTQDKKGVSAMKLHRQLGISYKAAWRMRHKLMQVRMERDREHVLGGFIQLDDAYLGGERSGSMRGRGAPGKTPFVAAVETHEAGTSAPGEAHRGRGLPSHRNRRLGAAAPSPGHAGALRWADLLQWRDRGRLRA